MIFWTHVVTNSHLCNQNRFLKSNLVEPTWKHTQQTIIDVMFSHLNHNSVYTKQNKTFPMYFTGGCLVDYAYREKKREKS